MSRNKIIIIVALVVVLIIILLYVFRDNLFAATPKVNTIINNSSDISIFPLKQGTISPSVGRIQSWLNSHGFKDCNGNILVVDNNFGPKTECAVKSAWNVTEVSQSLYNSLGI